MLKALVKKQIMEIFRNFFYDAKNSKAKSKNAIIRAIILYAVLMVVVLGGTFTAVAIPMCTLFEVGVGWLYFAIFALIGLVLGIFGSVFSTYSSLYLSKDNDLLLSMPIPIKTIMAARLLGVFIIGLLYSAVVMVPAVAVYWVMEPVTFGGIIGGIMMVIIVAALVFFLSCLLGWVVAKVSLKLKNKSFITVLISVVFIGLYYFVYFKAQVFIRELIVNASYYGTKIKSSAYIVYFFGRVGEGDWTAICLVTLIVALLCFATLLIISRSFLAIATASSTFEPVKYTQKETKCKTPFAALLTKEFSRFSASPNYMLNCGLGILLIPIAAVALVIKGGVFLDTLNSVFSAEKSVAPIVIFATAALLTAMIDMATPSVSLEGKSVWIPKSLPVSAKTVLNSKLSVQLILAGIPNVLLAIAAIIVLRENPLQGILTGLCIIMVAVLNSVFDMLIGVLMPNLTWTNEIYPIKQSVNTLIALLGAWVFGIIIGGAYFLFGYFIGAEIYLALVLVIMAALTYLLYRMLCTKGVERFENL